MITPYKKSFVISSYDLNPGGQARLTALAGFFQECAYKHATELGLGYHHLQENQTFWVLSRLRIHIDRYPLWDEVIEAETWPNGMERIFAMREFRIRDHRREVIGFASSAWLVVDLKTRHAMLVKDFKQLQTEPKESVFGEPLKKIRLPGTLSGPERRVVRQSDLDIVGHVNNVKYIEWSLDRLFSTLETEPFIQELEINYLNESLLSEEIEIKSDGTPGKEFFVSGTRLSDSKEIFRSRILMGEIPNNK
ncbi:MAG: hypothetical protein JXR52_02680 [Bacteroidales bacterium]|nr:hypothetical protein [Bacteroidales bacterium]